jgi:hypothetical protein
MAGKAFSRPGIGRRRVTKPPCEPGPAPQHLFPSTGSAGSKALPQVIPTPDGLAGRQHGWLAGVDRRRKSAFETVIIDPRQVLPQDC